MNHKKLNVYEFEVDSKNKYMLDNITGVVIPSSDSIKYIIENYSIDKGNIVRYLTNELKLSESIAVNQYNYVQALVNLGYFYKEDNSSISLDPESCEKLMLNSSGSQLLLILTEDCNLRCKYCIYSDQYNQYKSYSNKKMDFDTAKQAIDTYMMWYYEKKAHGFRENPRLSFYGGEPLLEYKLIEQIIEYCKEKAYEVEFLATTNGTILNQNIIEMVVNNNFNLTFSLDGNKMNHDRNRVFRNDEGTFDVIIDNLKHLQQVRRERKINQTLNFVCCFDNYTDMEAIIDFFESSKEFLGNFQVMFNEIYKYDTTYYNYCDSRYENSDLEINNKALATSIKSLSSKFLKEVREGKESSAIIKKLFQALFFYRYKSQGLVGLHGNACIPGDKIAVDSEGDFYICEKATQQYKIGNVQYGIDWDKVSELTNKFIKLRNQHCGDCNVSRLCDACYVHFMKNDDLEFNHSFCIDKRNSIKSTLPILFSTLEANPNAFYLDEENEEKQVFGEKNC